MAGTSPRQQLPIGIQRSRPKVMRRLQNWTHIGQSSSAFIGRVRSTQFCSRKRNMTDVELARALESGEIANENFRHASHLHVAWVYLAESSSVSEATSKMRNTLRRFAAAAGKPEKIPRDHHAFLDVSPLMGEIDGGSQKLAGIRSGQSAIARKKFATHLLFARAAFQRPRADFVGRARFETAFVRCHFVLFIQFTGQPIGSVSISIS